MEDKKDPHDGEYIGNIFGPKLTKWSAIVILAFSALAAYRHLTLDVPVGFTVEETQLDKIFTDTIPAEKE